MTLEQADLLEAYLNHSPAIRQAAVHERTCCAVIQYCGERSALLTFLSRFSYNTPEIAKLAPAHSGRALNRAYEEKLVGKVVFKVIRKCFLPPPLAAAYTVLKSIPYLVRGVRCLLQGKLRVELLDGLSIGILWARRDFSTAGSVMFLLSLGELLEEWTHKKSVDDLARCMSLNVDRVWLHTQEGEVLVPLNQIQPGDAISVRMGGLIPVDGMIVQGEVMVNQASLTGESVPVPKGPNTMVYAGTVVEEGECIIQVSQQNGSSRYDKIVSMIEQSEKLKSAAGEQSFPFGGYTGTLYFAGKRLGVSADTKCYPGAFRSHGGFFLCAETGHAVGGAFCYAGGQRKTCDGKRRKVPGGNGPCGHHCL